MASPALLRTMYGGRPSKPECWVQEESGQDCCGTENGRIVTMKKMKKFAALFLAAALVTACVACGNDAGTDESGSSVSEESSSESSEGSTILSSG